VLQQSIYTTESVLLKWGKDNRLFRWFQPEGLLFLFVKDNSIKERFIKLIEQRNDVGIIDIDTKDQEKEVLRNERKRKDVFPMVIISSQEGALTRAIEEYAPKTNIVSVLSRLPTNKNGPKPRTGNITTRELARIINVPNSTLRGWEEDRPELFWALKAMSEKEAKAFIKRGQKVSQC